MKFSDLLDKFDSNSIFKNFIAQATKRPSVYIDIIQMGNNYKIMPKDLFYRVTNSSRVSILIDSKYNILEHDCGCLQYYRNKECMHVAALYSLALYELDNEYYHLEYKAYNKRKNAILHSNLLNTLTKEINKANPYFGQIHLIPIIELNEAEASLSIKIGYDKDYVVKDIQGFIDMTENHKAFEYGQKLNLEHSYECFDDVSKEFYSFISNIINDNTTKSISIRKSHLLKILEMYQGNTIQIKTINESKSLPRRIVKLENINILLDANNLHIKMPEDTKILVCGVNNAYFINNEIIYKYSYKSRMEGKLLDGLFKVNGSLLIESNSRAFITNLLPIIKNNITVLDEFYEKYPIPDIKINSYLSYIDNSICLNTKIACKELDKNSPYLKQLLEGYFNTIESYYFVKKDKKLYSIDSLEEQFKFLTSDLSSIKAFGNVFFDESMKSIKAKKSTRTRINVSYNVGLLDFTLENSELSLEDIKDMLKAYHEKKRFVKLKDDTILEIEEETAKEISDFLEDFNISVNDITKKIKKPLNYMLKLVNEADKNLSMTDELYDMILKIRNYKNNDYLPNDHILKHLREYQLEGFKWLKTLASFNFGGVLADDMGLGKTIEIISFLDSDSKEMPSLIVCPMSLVYNWQYECEKWNLNCPVKLVLGGLEDRENIIKSIDENKKVLYITSYDSLRRDVSLYNNKFRFIIADEAQYIKNQFAQKSEAIKSISSEINFALTGTPIENGLSDLWSIFDFLMPGYLSSYSRFKSRYEALIVNDDEEALLKLQKRVSPFILRRTKKDVLKDLPDKIEDYYYCKMSDKQREIYEAYVGMLKDDLNQGGNNILALLTRLRQICITPELIYNEGFENTKINLAVDLIKSSIEGNHRILVFSQFAQSFPILSKELEKTNIKHFILDGSTKAKTRIEMVEEFNNNPDIKVFIISLKAGGTGLNLVGADMVIHLDPWWNSSAEIQATDRAYRLGQTKNVYVLKLICKDTIEEKVLKLQNIKKELAESIIADENTQNIKISKNDILELLD